MTSMSIAPCDALPDVSSRLKNEDREGAIAKRNVSVRHHDVKGISAARRVSGRSSRLPGSDEYVRPSSWETDIQAVLAGPKASRSEPGTGMCSLNSVIAGSQRTVRGNLQYHLRQTVVPQILRHGPKEVDWTACRLDRESGLSGCLVPDV